MPLTKKGRKIKGMFIQNYGKTRGTRFFYGYEHKHPGLIRGKRR